MKLPAIYSTIGDWEYYVCSMTFKEINNSVSRITNELHRSEKLSELLQRAITSNYKKIADYIQQHDERFFNAIVLAVYEGAPQFIEVDFMYEGIQYGKMGLLDFTGGEIIFPVDGQHRVEGIKKVLETNQTYEADNIPVIFIGHSNSSEGMKRTRKLFTTLNRYAKPVRKSEIIALEEDDIVAITTRHLVENHRLFKEDHISLATTLQTNDNTSITTIETLYDCTDMLLINYLKEKEYRISKENFKKVRPSPEDINEFQAICEEFWDIFISTFNDVSNYLETNETNTQLFRNSNGGNLLFRPVGLSPFIKSVSIIKERTNETYREILGKMNLINMNLNEQPWKYVLWNEAENKVRSGNSTLARYLFLFLYEKYNEVEVLRNNEKVKLVEKYSNNTNLEVSLVTEALSEL
ncbi:hypothetical protein GCM10007216_03780 [Thalassobacillus devorans]|uniref:DGQHR domain-containing protein n=1 Tax=Thalassobacillus devorans TaxID=279813 RepID=A0ABQ1NGH5_9BACI|nr:DNA sulfur modification protein DndB [Thalassobacillus devorans]NIK27286.1 DNA sulfur modification protein DndB [Thalassobacillus devorans]GGC76470.1 hypothetical protein GCM10007216_03780 [Thalassobacillus devorans]